MGNNIAGLELNFGYVTGYGYVKVRIHSTPKHLTL